LSYAKYYVPEFMQLNEKMGYFLRFELFVTIMEYWNIGMLEQWFFLKDVIPLLFFIKTNYAINPTFQLGRSP
jgi:hypothetical protein